MNDERKMEARAFAKLLSHIETSVQEGTFCLSSQNSMKDI